MEKKLLIPEQQVISKKQSIDDFNAINFQQFGEIRYQIDQAIKMGVPPEQPVQLPTIVVIGLIRMVDNLSMKLESLEVTDENKFQKQDQLDDILSKLKDEENNQ